MEDYVTKVIAEHDAEIDNKMTKQRGALESRLAKLEDINIK